MQARGKLRNETRRVTAKQVRRIRQENERRYRRVTESFVNVFCRVRLSRGIRNLPLRSRRRHRRLSEIFLMSSLRIEMENARVQLYEIKSANFAKYTTAVYHKF